jgi:hypothetical protein
MAQQAEANQFTFSDANDTTQIVYYPQAPGPVVGQLSPQLRYSGPEGNFTFRNGVAADGNVETQASPLGQLITVVLKKSIDAGALTLILVLPSVNLAGQSEQDFDTVAIKTRSYGILPREGALQTYEVVYLDGKAAQVILPFTEQAQS